VEKSLHWRSREVRGVGFVGGQKYYANWQSFDGAREDKQTALVFGLVVIGGVAAIVT
jgi:hypothetical protein